MTSGDTGRSWSILVSVVLLCCWCSTASAQQVEKGGEIRHIRVTSVTPEKVDAGWRLIVSGDCARIPAGTKVEFALTYRGLVVDTIPVKLGGGDRFTLTLLSKKARVTRGKLRLRSTIRREDQSASVRAAMDEDREYFPEHQKQWVDYQFENPVTLGSAEELAKMEGRIRAYFVDRYRQLIDLDTAVGAAVRQAKDGDKKYTEGASFSAKRWHAAFTKEFMLPLADMQAQMEGCLENVEYFNYRRPLADLQEISFAVAGRALHRQELLFEGLNIELTDVHRNPEGVDVTMAIRVVPKASYLARRWDAIAAALGMGAPEEDQESRKTPPPKKSNRKETGQK